ncbi:unnamed protein product [Linum trigynum]|uniref:Uncharacterized protein n=1 Tax=Linum trigynum TaxID=586398 RepID=A0AAV2GSB8_9ROSI
MGGGNFPTLAHKFLITGHNGRMMMGVRAPALKQLDSTTRVQLNANTTTSKVPSQLNTFYSSSQLDLGNGAITQVTSKCRQAATIVISNQATRSSVTCILNNLTV